MMNDKGVNIIAIGCSAIVFAAHIIAITCRKGKKTLVLTMR